MEQDAKALALSRHTKIPSKAIPDSLPSYRAESGRSARGHSDEAAKYMAELASVRLHYSIFAESLTSRVAVLSPELVRLPDRAFSAARRRSTHSTLRAVSPRTAAPASSSSRRCSSTRSCRSTRTSTWRSGSCACDSTRPRRSRSRTGCGRGAASSGLAPAGSAGSSPRFARDHRAELVVVGSPVTSRRGFRRPFPQEILQILRDAPCRVMVATGPYAGRAGAGARPGRLGAARSAA